MGSQLREALRCLCVEIGWSYAVFWRSIGSKSLMHLVFEDGHVVDNRLEVLVNKIMAQQVHLLGEGMVGQAAATGSHQWIRGNNIHVGDSGAQDLGELNHQFLAGIQAIAVIPVLPHGVLQLGSTQMVMENINFVNHVKSIFAQLEGMKEALLPDRSRQTLGQNSQLCDGVSVTASELLPDKLIVTTTSIPLPDALQPRIHPASKTNLHFNSQFESKPMRVHGMLSNPGTRLIQPAVSHDSTSKYQDQSSLFTTSSSSSIFPFHEQQVAAFNINSWETAKRVEPDSGNNRTFSPNPHGSVFPDMLKDSNSNLFSGGSETGGSVFGSFTSLLGGIGETSKIISADLSSSETVQMLNERTLSKSQGIQVDTFPTHLSVNTSEPVMTTGTQRQENGLFKACNTPFSESDVNSFCNRALLGTLQGCRLTNAFQENKRDSSDACGSNGPNISQLKIEDNEKSKFSHDVLPTQFTSGDSLYDILGVDYKVNNFGGSLDVLINDDDASVHEVAADTSTCSARLDVCPMNQSLDDISGVGIFSTRDTDQLLDSVVSKISPGAKENSDDGVSCSTSTRNTSTPSVPVISPCYELLASEKMQGESSCLPPFGKAEGLGCSSAKPSRSLGNKTEDCSLSAGISRSQISLWVDSGQSTHSDSILGTQNKKCSIDALLEKTIKHMLFLQSVAKHADTLKDIGEPKLIDKEGGIHLKEKFDGGATWAFQVGSQSRTCPIIVEDLKPPRQMLVEMLCKQRGFFLEIAELIRGLGLTILKGVMEAHKDKIWARFAVEDGGVPVPCSLVRVNCWVHYSSTRCR
ncbi:uncharacterized protein A4U43_C09F1360 [Asparagus officinalis]|uniref:Transcription factor MYC/MYB N-terminal domain-containing protein n=1 Tax=Asparagus officinalis TaxID=4686 RepID=A0A5P1E4D2_ASPOF|nr:uncharacterized protein A4U43_C09F1360 [Asparagus officinalis]